MSRKVATFQGNDTQEAWRDELSDLGFPDTALYHAERARDAGLFSREPPPGLAESVVQRCRTLLAQPSLIRSQFTVGDIGGIASHYRLAMAELEGIMSAYAPAHSMAWASVARLATECIAAADYTLETKQRPVVVLDNHDIVRPSWWTSDACFMAMRDAIVTVNGAALEISAPPSAVVMILHSDIGSYSARDMRALGDVFETSTSDIWLLPHHAAGSYRNQDVLVCGHRTLTLMGQRSTPVAAIQAFREAPTIMATEIRAEIECMTNGLREVRGRFDASDVRDLLNDVIVSGSGVKFSAERIEAD